MLTVPTARDYGKPWILRNGRHRDRFSASKTEVLVSNSNNNNDSCIRLIIVVKDFKSKACLLIDVACPQDCNVSRVATYKDLRIEVTKMWKLETKLLQWLFDPWE